MSDAYIGEAGWSLTRARPLGRVEGLPNRGKGLVGRGVVRSGLEVAWRERGVSMARVLPCEFFLPEFTGILAGWGRREDGEEASQTGSQAEEQS